MTRKPARDVRRGDGYITQRVISTGETRYQARWHDGIRWKAKTFRVLDDAEDHLREIGRKKRRREYVPDEEYTLLDVVDDYLERGESRWRANTLWNYRKFRDNHIEGNAIGGALIDALTPRRMQRWIDELGASLAPSSVRTIRAMVTGALNEAMRLGAISRNPLDGVRLPRKPKAKIDHWSRDEVASILDAAKDDPLLYPYYVVAVSTGMRPGEILALAWADVDLDAGVITCRNTLTRNADGHTIVGTGTKTGHDRRIVIPGQTVDVLRSHRRAQAERRLAHLHWHDGDLVFDRGNGIHVSASSVRQEHRTMCERAGVRVIRLHAIRHTAATLLVEAGIDFKTISDMLGHSQISMTLDLYAHVTPAMERRAADVMSGVLDKKHA